MRFKEFIKQQYLTEALTINKVNDALKQAGYGVELIKDKDHFYFHGDDTHKWHETVVPVWKISDLTIKQWLDYAGEFKNNPRNIMGTNKAEKNISEDMWTRIKSIMKKSKIPSAQMSTTMVRGYKNPSRMGYTLSKNTFEGAGEISIEFVDSDMKPTPIVMKQLKEWCVQIEKTLKELNIEYTKKITQYNIQLFVRFGNLQDI